MMSLKQKIKRLRRCVLNRRFRRNRFSLERFVEYEINGDLWNTKITSLGGNIIKIDTGARVIDSEIIIKGRNNNLYIGKYVRFCGRIEMFSDGNNITIGDYSKFGQADLIIHNGTDLVVGNHSLISSGVTVRSTDSHRIFDKDGVQLNPDGDVVIGEHVWIGAGVTILKGSKIGSGSVIGTKSIVVGVVPENSLAAGIPARVKKSEIRWEK